MTKPSTKKIDGKKLIEEAKEKVKQAKKETKMNNIKSNQTVKTIVTVFVTLLSVAALVGAFYLGTQFQDSVNKEVANQVTVQVKELATATTLKK